MKGDLHDVDGPTYEEIWQDPDTPNDYIYTLFEKRPILNPRDDAFYTGSAVGAMVARLLLADHEVHVKSELAARMGQIVEAIAWSVLFHLQRQMSWDDDTLYKHANALNHRMRPDDNS